MTKNYRFKPEKGCEKRVVFPNNQNCNLESVALTSLYFHSLRPHKRFDFAFGPFKEEEEEEREEKEEKKKPLKLVRA